MLYKILLLLLSLLILFRRPIVFFLLLLMIFIFQLNGLLLRVNLTLWMMSFLTIMLRTLFGIVGPWWLPLWTLAQSIVTFIYISLILSHSFRVRCFPLDKFLFFFQSLIFGNFALILYRFLLIMSFCILDSSLIW